MKIFTKSEAIEHDKKIVACDRKFHRDIRILLVEAYEGKSHEALRLGSFDQYLTKLSEKTISLSVKHLRRIAKAGLIEIDLIGRDNVGKMSGAALRAFSENMKPEHIKMVYKQVLTTNKTIKPHPTGITGTQVIEAAKKLGVYKQQPSKKKNQGERLNKEITNKNAVPHVKSKAENSGNNQTTVKTTKRPQGIHKPLETETSNITKISKLPAIKKGRNL